MASTEISLKLLIDTKCRKVLFAEVGKDFVDFLFALLSFPVGTVIRLLLKNGMVGCLSNLYESIEKLNETYLQPNQNKDTLLKPKVAVVSGYDAPLLLTEDESINRKQYYMCSNYHHNVADNPKAICPACKRLMNTEIPFVAPTRTTSDQISSDEGGFVKGVVTYMVMDDLVVKPMSTISGITLLNKFNVQELGSLEERVVTFDMAEGLKLLKYSLSSKTVLSSVFLGNTGP
ncbi:hypothetical protein F2P56_028413 [Juglans regia]|uniref:Uncharacterized protein LOC109002981 n=2 Tax=Juglans regia TaxID=51240 RepID=A0A2I4FXU2_JUGRE|nr:uncharacterized protein LOC109002981 [Juglans regia]KAF5453516.1 hypothetical protein F2P56_028413 [Juglans regia]